MSASLPRRDRFLILICLAAITALSWAYLIHLGRAMSASMAEMDAMAKMGMPMEMPWAVKMVAMMTASAVPAVLVMAKSRVARGEGRFSPVTVLFTSGYLLVWGGFSLAAALAQWGLHEAALLSPAMMTTSSWLAGGVLIVAGVYQWTPLKQQCLSHC